MSPLHSFTFLVRLQGNQVGFCHQIVFIFVDVVAVERYIHNMHLRTILMLHPCFTLTLLPTTWCRIEVILVWLLYFPFVGW